MPFTIAPIACSLIPYSKFLPEKSDAENVESPMICLVEAVRSADPPRILLVCFPISFNIFDPAIRVACVKFS